MAGLLERFKSAATVFRDPSLTTNTSPSYGAQVYSQTRHYSVGFATRENVVGKIYNRIAVDVASASIRHVRLGKDNRYEDDIDSYLNRCLTFRPNIDQTARAFYQDLVWSMFEGDCAIVPVDTTANIFMNAGFDVRSMRVGVIKEWYPRHVKVNLYNDRTGIREDVVVPKENVAIVHNPMYEVMSRPDSDLRRLIRKLELIDKIDDQLTSGQLDLIIQLPYEVRSDLKKEQAERRRKDLEEQLTNSQLGIGYVGATERITQLNRPVTNNLLAQIEYLTKQVYNTLGLTEEVFNGTASPQVMLNYYNTTINPILDEIAAAFTWGFLSQTARSQGQAVKWFRSPFALVTMDQFPGIAVQLSTAEIATSNEIRAELGWKPAKDANADKLVNPNVNPVESESSESEDTPEGDDRSFGEMTIDEL